MPGAETTIAASDMWYAEAAMACKALTDSGSGKRVKTFVPRGGMG